MSDKTKNYKKGELTIVWKPNLCIHAANCVKGLPGVFKPKETPWIKPEHASKEAIIAQIDNCPSGALSYTVNEIVNKEKDTLEKYIIDIQQNGPIIIKGAVEIHCPDGSLIKREKNTALCRCGATRNRPLCDGSHKEIGYRD